MITFELSVWDSMKMYMWRCEQITNFQIRETPRPLYIVFSRVADW